jgi:protein O-GlcNAc transferase
MTVSDTLIRAIESQNQGKLDTAVTLFEKTLKLDPKNAHAYYSLALIALNAGQVPQALELARKGTVAAPLFAPLRYLHGAVLQRMGDKEGALKSFDEALRLQPTYPEVLLNSGALLRSMFRHKEALERFNQILGIDPNHTSALANCGILLTEFKQSAHAIKMFERLIELKPDYDYALGLLFYERMHICDWTGFDDLSAKIVQGVRAGKRVCKSLAFMSASDSASDHQMAARMFADQYCPPAPKKLWNGEKYQHEKMRIAYVSPDFREHPVGHLMAGIFEHHDKSKFETIAISLGIDDNSRLRARMLKAFDKFIDAREMGAEQIARLMRDMEVDIAIDLGGFTSDTRTEVLAFKPAPIQVNYLGYPGTMGTQFMDYILADRHIIPPEHQAFYNEKVAYLPDTYLPTDNSVGPSARTPTRAECGLPDQGFVFCSFSHDYKISPPVFDVWMNLLRKVPGSVLWLVSRGELTQKNLRDAAKAKGVDPARLVFASRVPLVEDHLARYRQADIFLDTHPYNAHTTAADALMVGLPVVTYMGNSFPSRVAGSLLHAVGMPELVAQSLADYEALALSLASNPDRLQSIKAKLAANQRTHALFNTPQFCRNLEAVLVKMHQGLPTAEAPTPSSLPAATASTPTPTLSAKTLRRLHIGGKVRTDGWEVLNVIPAPEVDHLGNAKDLSMFADGTFDVIYSSHVLEHFDYQDELHNTLVEWSRVIKPGGLLQVCVPDLEVLAKLTLNKELATNQRFMVMRMMFGGHINAYDYHQVGLTEEFLRDFLTQAGFEHIERVSPFGLFHDNSNYIYAGELISLNMQARKPAL